MRRFLSLRSRLLKHPYSTATSSAPPKTIEIFIDGQPLQVPQGLTLIQACEMAGHTIPRFCYHDRLSVAGNCRMCLVEVEKVPKPVASCAYPLQPGMRVFTNTPMVHKAREGVMEFLLSNHPLDCPICDQGGECDLQDQSIRYGSDRGRFREWEGKRAVEDKDFGPLIKTTMTRCIHCTRCVRFANEMAGAEELGTSGRGNDMQIGTYIQKVLDSEVSANIIDLCPVGALTSKPYEYKSRPWELKKTESVDVMDALGSAIRVDSRGLEVLRVLPRVNEDINEEWISDKTRFACDGLKRQRLTSPMVREGGQFVSVSWSDALNRVARAMQGVQGEEMTAVVGQLADAEAMVALKDLLSKHGSSNFRMDGAYLHRPPVHGCDFRSNYTLNSGIPAPEEADCLLLIGTNPRHEGAIFNLRIRKSYLHNGLNIGLIGTLPKLNYEVEHVGVDVEALQALVDGKHAFAKTWAAAKKPMVVVGSGAVEHADSQRVYSLLSQLVKKQPNLLTDSWNGINVLQRNAAHAAALDIGFQPGPNATDVSQSKFIYLLGADQLSAKDLPSDAFVVYQGHHGDVGAHYADVILPGCAYTEKTATYVNTEGRAQLTRAAVSPPGEAREDWKILRALSEVVGQTLPYDDVHGLRERMAEVSPSLVQYGVKETPFFTRIGLEAATLFADASKSKGSAKGKNAKEPFGAVVQDFYMTDSISRASSTMAKCSALYTHAAGDVKNLEATQ